MGQPMISLTNVSFSYRGAESPSLSSLSLDVKAGECVLLCGKSGCGKSTVLRLLNGMIPEFFDGDLTGRVRVGGMDPTTCPQYKVARQVGTVFQNPRTQFYTLDTTSEVAFGCENRGMPRAEISRRVNEAAADLGIAALMNRNIFHLSGGEKQRVAIASVYATGPEVLLLDEPSANLDFPAIRELRRTLDILRSKGKTILIAEHRTWYLEGIVDRAVYLDGGKASDVFAMGELASLTRSQRLETGIRPVKLEGFDLPRTVAPVKDTPMHEMHLADLVFSYSRHAAPSLSVPDAQFGSGSRRGDCGRQRCGQVDPRLGGVRARQGTARQHRNRRRRALREKEAAP